MIQFPKWYISLDGKEITISKSGTVLVDGSVTDLKVLPEWTVTQVTEMLWKEFGPKPEQSAEQLV